MPLVVDTSVTLAWCLPDEQHAVGVQALAQVVEQGAVVPGLWHLEIANALLMAQRRRRIDPPVRERLLRELSGLPIEVDKETSARAWGEITRLADRYGLTIYDATYLELAGRLSFPLATLDRALQVAARTHGVDVLGEPA